MSETSHPPRQIVTQGQEAWKWTAKRRQAVLFIADGRTGVEAAKLARVDRKAVERWMRRPEFLAEIERLRKQFETEIFRKKIARKAKRLDRLNADWERLQQVTKERGEDPTMADVPGGRTGLLCRTIKSVGAGDNCRIVEEYAVDGTLLKELREHERQAAIELGQWEEGATLQATQIKLYIGINASDV